MSELGNKIRTKLPRIILNLAVMFSVWFIATLVAPAVQSLGAIIPGSQVSTGFLVVVSMVIVIAYFALAVVNDVLSIVETLADALVHLTPVIKETEANNLRKAAKELAIAVMLILLTPILPGTLALIPVIGPTFATVILFALVVAALSLFWAAGKILYKELSRYTGQIAEVVAGQAEKAEAKATKPLKKPVETPRKKGKKR